MRDGFAVTEKPELLGGHARQIRQALRDSNPHSPAAWLRQTLSRRESGGR